MIALDAISIVVLVLLIQPTVLVPVLIHGKAIIVVNVRLLLAEQINISTVVDASVIATLPGVQAIKVALYAKSLDTARMAQASKATAKCAIVRPERTGTVQSAVIVIFLILASAKTVELTLVAIVPNVHARSDGPDLSVTRAKLARIPIIIAQMEN